MTFEEFFQKKKIDLKKLASERPALFEEFKKHFVAMGEKSFDHTKKYWFNKLRKSYPLAAAPADTRTAARSGTATPPPAETKVAAASKTATAATNSGSGAPTSKPTGFKPRFKAGKTVTAPKAPGNTEDTPDVTEKTSGATPTTSGTAQKSSSPSTAAPAGAKEGTNDPLPPSGGTKEEKKPTSPPAYKPRFRPGTTPPQKKE